MIDILIWLRVDGNTTAKTFWLSTKKSGTTQIYRNVTYVGKLFFTVWVHIERVGCKKQDEWLRNGYHSGHYRTRIPQSRRTRLFQKGVFLSIQQGKCAFLSRFHEVLRSRLPRTLGTSAFGLDVEQTTISSTTSGRNHTIMAHCLVC